MRAQALTLCAVQLWEHQQNGSITNGANGFCLSVAAVPCGHLGVCNTGMDQTGTAGTILSVIAEPCSKHSQSQSWHVQAVQDFEPPEFVWLNVSAAMEAPARPTIADKVETTTLQVSSEAHAGCLYTATCTC